MSATDNWLKIKESLPVGSLVHGTVVRVAPFGVFVKLREVEAIAALLVTHFDDGDRRFEIEDYPQVGASIRAIVVDLADHNMQVRISTRRFDLERVYSKP